MIEVNNLSKEKVKEDFLNKIAKTILGNKKFDLSVALIGQSRIKELNAKYRKLNRPTDVLSFSYGNSGEVVLCPEIIEKNARKYGVNFEDELSRILIHGILHLFGYDHEKDKDAGLMRKKEEYYLSKIYGKR
jgi:probable rRNA maturation factor